MLLDMHAQIWSYEGDTRLSAPALTTITDPSNEKLVSPASYWEIAIKLSLGKYALTEPYEDFVKHAISDNGFFILPIEPTHTGALVSLPFHHRDPFDRLLVAQALAERIPILRADPQIDNYPITRIW